MAMSDNEAHPKAADDVHEAKAVLDEVSSPSGEEKFDDVLSNLSEAPALGTDEPDRSTQGASKSPEQPKRLWLRRLVQFGSASAVGLLVLWIAIHRVTWLGPAIADGMRSVFGARAVAWLEDVAYGLQDRFNMWRYKGKAPKTFWTATKPSAAAPAPVASPSVAPVAKPKKPSEPPFAPAAFVPPHPEVATPADGMWAAVVDRQRPQARVIMHKTMVHPDRRRGFAALAVVAMERKSFRLTLVAGTVEPQTHRLSRKQRPGRIPASAFDSLVAAFNGGFKSTHGQYGMMLDGVEFVPARGYACTFVRYKSGLLDLGTWSSLKGKLKRMTYYRQTPPCLVEKNKLHKALHYHEYAKGWGATVSGETIIRRSAIGLNADRRILYYGLGEAMTAQSLARGMKAAGAVDVAELDVNHSYPRFLFYDREPGQAQPYAREAIIPAIEYKRDEYVGRSSRRDFFYLTRKEAKKAQADLSGSDAYASE